MLLQNTAKFNFTSVHRLPLDCLLEETIAGLYMGSEIFREIYVVMIPMALSFFPLSLQFCGQL